MSEAEQDEQQGSFEVSLPIDWHYPENLLSRYANNVLVQNGKYASKFGQIVTRF